MSEPKTYVTKPVTVEAFHWTNGSPRAPLYKFTNHLTRLDDVNDEFFVYNRMIDRWIPFDYNDYIVKGREGEFYPLKYEEFNELYKPTMVVRDNGLPGTSTLEYKVPR